jgi:hypothetical protein
MANLIDTTYFDGGLILAGITDSSVSIPVTAAIVRYEPEYLGKVLGPSLYVAYAAGIAAGSPEARWTALRDGVSSFTAASNGRTYIWPGFRDATTKLSPIADYVYWHYRNKNISQTTQSGEAVAKSENATIISPILDMVAAWNHMVSVNEILFRLLYKNDDYPEFDRCELDRDLFEYQNADNI